jgi:hypothetical protein
VTTEATFVTTTGQSATDRPQIWDFTRRVVAVSRGALRVNIIKQAH